MRQEGNILYSDEGKCLIYKHSNTNFGSEVSLGYRIINSEMIKDTIEDFYEINEPQNNNEINNI